MIGKLQNDNINTKLKWSDGQMVIWSPAHISAEGPFRSGAAAKKKCSLWSLNSLEVLLKTLIQTEDTQDCDTHSNDWVTDHELNQGISVIVELKSASTWINLYCLCFHLFFFLTLLFSELLCSRFCSKFQYFAQN